MLAEYVTPEVAPVKPVVVIVSEDLVPAVIVTTAEADFVESAVLVALMVAVVLLVTVGAWYKPLLLTAPADADQVTPTFDVLLTVAVNCTVPEEATVAVAGSRVTVISPWLETVI